MKIDFFIWRDQNGEIFCSKQFDHKKRIQKNAPQKLIDFLQEIAQDLGWKDFQKKSGILVLPEFGPALVTSLPILKSNSERHPRGNLLAIRVMNEDLLSVLQSITKLALKTPQVEVWWSRASFSPRTLLSKKSIEVFFRSWT